MERRSGSILEHLRERSFCYYFGTFLTGVHAEHTAATAGQITHDGAGILVGNGDVVLIDGLYQGMLCFGAGFLVSKTVRRS